ncbi:phage tail protein [Escherichia coli]|uniref:phage tail protein n=1 Tax=Escherichia coli TaxID=562 RepID=UPI001BA7FE0B|nr:phage tail protein [Escherichia coli]MBS0068604.1 phage tail protein [Escherichia coli]MBS0073101.1 phage tail protein [Escherichia coli]MBS0082339.1 phage tail protein [Escherichia coli]MBS0091315.1 phage tail protein [Escherichia coli]MBS0095927.1 phage tail protein [Escherichia coli]
MTAKYFAILTNQGAARLANAAALGTKLNLTQMAVGDANGVLPTPDPAQTKLINQKRIAPLNLLTVDPANTSQIIAEQIIPENEGGFWIREIGLYDDDGILIAVANCPETYKPELQEGSGRTQTIRMILIVSSTSAITLKIDPSVVLATRKYADDKAIELKLYVDDLMSKHLAAADPHSQYATKDSPTFTGKPKAPTPPVVANDTQVATAGFVQAVIAALVSGELANKQPLDKTLTDLSGKDVAAILEYLGLKTAAQRNVGAGDIANIPDMSFFRASMLANGYVYLPVIGAGGGAQTFMIQWGQASAPPNSVAAYNLNVAFPNSILFAVGNRWADGSNASMNVKPLGTQQIRIQNWAPSGSAEICSWLAIGY